MEQKRRITWYVVIGLVVVGLIAVLWVRYAGMQRLMGELDSKHPEIQTRAARVLLQKGVLGDSLPAQSEKRRANAAIAVGRVGTDAAMTELVALIKDPEDLPQRAAAKAMGRLGAKAIRFLLPVLKEGDDRAKAAAVTAFDIIGEPAVPALTKALRNKDRRAQAAIALGKIGGSGLEPLLRAARSKSDELRKIAIQALGEARDKRAAPAAIAALRKKDLRRTAIIALGLMGDPQTTAYLLPYLNDGDLRIDAATSVGQIGDPRATAPLLAALRDPERQFHERGVWALRRIGVPGVPVMTAALHGDSAYVRGAAAEGLRWTHVPASIPPLVSALDDSDWMVRVAAARALGWAGNAAAVQPLLATFNDQDWRVSAAAVTALGDVDGPAVEPLVALFNSPDPIKQMLASDALVEMGNTVVPRLLQASRSASAPTTVWAVITLGKVGDRAAVDRLRELAATGEGRIKWAAGEALRRLGGEKIPG
jgi:HEAT repeat protein